MGTMRSMKRLRFRLNGFPKWSLAKFLKSMVLSITRTRSRDYFPAGRGRKKIRRCLPS